MKKKQLNGQIFILKIKMLIKYKILESIKMDNSFFINQRKVAVIILPVHALTTFIAQILLWMKLT